MAGADEPAPPGPHPDAQVRQAAAELAQAAQTNAMTNLQNTLSDRIANQLNVRHALDEMVQAAEANTITNLPTGQAPSVDPGSGGRPAP